MSSTLQPPMSISPGRRIVDAEAGSPARPFDPASTLHPRLSTQSALPILKRGRSVYDFTVQMTQERAGPVAYHGVAVVFFFSTSLYQHSFTKENGGWRECKREVALWRLAVEAFWTKDRAKWYPAIFLFLLLTDLSLARPVARAVDRRASHISGRVGFGRTGHFAAQSEHEEQAEADLRRWGGGGRLDKMRTLKSPLHEDGFRSRRGVVVPRCLWSSYS